jgi:hypothetical protein
MEHDTACRSLAQEESFEPSQALELLGEYRHEVVAAHKKAGRPPEISWLHFGMGVLLCFWRGWHHQRDRWRLLGWQQVGGFAPVPQTDQAIYNRLAHADVQMQALFQQVTAWLRQRLWPWQERSLAPFATAVLALDESTLDQVARWLPNLRRLERETRSCWLGAWRASSMCACSNGCASNSSRRRCATAAWPPGR